MHDAITNTIDQIEKWIAANPHSGTDDLDDVIIRLTLADDFACAALDEATYDQAFDAVYAGAHALRRED